MAFEIGTVVTVTGTFTDAAGNLVDSGQVRVKVRDPQLQITTYTYGGGPEVVRVSQGIYRIEIYLSKPYEWRVRFEGNMSNRASEEIPIQASESVFYNASGGEVA